MLRRALAVAFAVSIAQAWQNQSPAAPAGPPHLVNSHSVLRLSGQEKTQVTEDVVYADNGGQTQKTDIYLPQGVRKSDRLPAVIALSGGDFTKHWGFYKDLGRQIAASGMAGVIPDKRYRRGQHVEGSEDIASLMKYLAENGEQHNIDGSRVCLWAFSAGGLLLSTGMGGQTPQVKCLVNFYAVTDLSPFPDVSPEVAASDYNPIQRLRADPSKVPPVMVVRAGKDSEVLNRGLDAFVSEALARNVEVVAVNYPEGQHGFDLWDDNDTSRRIIRQALEFERLHLGVH